MKKEYSDLPKSQRPAYNLALVIDLTFTISAMFIFAIGLATRLMEVDAFVYMVVLALGFALMCGVFFAYGLKSALKLYTDIDLEKAERRVQKIKDALKDE
jgi:purine-cytosine permease-like protein